MLHCSRETHSNIKLRSDDLSSLTDLQLVWTITCIDCCPGCSNSRITERVRKGIDNSKILFALHSPTPRNHDSRWSQIWLSRIGTFFLHEFSLWACWKRDFSNLRASGCCWCFIEIRGSEGQKVDILAGLHFGQCVTGVGGPHVCIFRLYYEESTTTSVISPMGCAEKYPATLGMISFPTLLLKPTIFLYPPLPTSPRMMVVTSSANLHHV